MSSLLLTETPKSQLLNNYIQNNNRNMLEPTKKDTLHPKTEKVQWNDNRGYNHDKIKSLPARWATHKLENSYTTEVLLQEWKSWAHSRLPSLSVWQWRRSPQRNWLWRPVEFDCRNSTGLRETETPLLAGCTQGLVCIRTKGKKEVSS